MSINAWLDAVIGYLAGALADVDVLKGEGDGVARDRDTMYVWWPGWQRQPRDISQETPTLLLRFCPHRSKQPATSVPADPTALIQGADQIRDAFTRATEASGFFTAGVACYLQSLTPNYDPAIWHVDGTIAGLALRSSA